MTIHAAQRKPTLADRYNVDLISEQAHQVQPLRVVLGVIAGLLFGIGWLIGKTFQVLFFAGAWGAVAIRTGWRSARGTPLNQPRLEDVMAENAHLRAELARVS